QPQVTFGASRIAPGIASWRLPSSPHGDRRRARMSLDSRILGLREPRRIGQSWQLDMQRDWPRNGAAARAFGHGASTFVPSVHRRSPELWAPKDRTRLGERGSYSRFPEFFLGGRGGGESSNRSAAPPAALLCCNFSGNYKPDGSRKALSAALGGGA